MFGSDTTNIKGAGFPYTIPREPVEFPGVTTPSPPPEASAKSGPVALKQQDGSDAGAANKQHVPPPHLDNDVGNGLGAPTSNVPSFSVRPSVSTGRLLYDGAQYRRSGYGFGQDVIVDTSTLTRPEARILKRKLRDWSSETHYQPSIAESTRFHSNLRGKCVGLLTGAAVGYAAVPYLRCASLQPSVPRAIVSAACGLVGSALLSYWVMPAVYIDVLQLNTPMGYKCRQFLYELRELQGLHDQTPRKAK